MQLGASSGRSWASPSPRRTRSLRRAGRACGSGGRRPWVSVWPPIGDCSAATKVLPSAAWWSRASCRAPSSSAWARRASRLRQAGQGDLTFRGLLHTRLGRRSRAASGGKHGDDAGWHPADAAAAGRAQASRATCSGPSGFQAAPFRRRGGARARSIHVVGLVWGARGKGASYRTGPGWVVEAPLPLGSAAIAASTSSTNRGALIFVGRAHSWIATTCVDSRSARGRVRQAQ